MASSWFRVYRFATGALAPFAARRLARAATGVPELLARQPERRGHVPDAGGEIWVHAASVGELNAAEPLVRALLDRQRRIVLTTLTHTAAEQARRRFENCDAVRHLFAPLDTVACVSRWLDHTRPHALVLVETEIWPVTLDQCRRRSIPVAMVNARISSRAMRRYQRFAGLFRHALSAVDPVLCQDDASRQRFEALGVDVKRIAVTGNLKFDADSPAAPNDELRSWQRLWSSRPAWVAGSTHAGEECIVANAHRRLLKEQPDALLLVVPRHPERGPEAFDALAQAGLEACMVQDWPARVAQGSNRAGGEKAVGIQAIVVDRMGVLTGLYSLVDACVVCGSLVEGTGGHNLIEPALAGKPILTGVHTADQQAAADGLESANGLVRVDSAIALADRLAQIFTQPEYARQLAANASAFADSQRGALERTLDALEPWLAKPANQLTS
jgi:3-deoxy-D-manno-octulosonic-acid transferase